MGGYLSMRLAATRPDLVRGLVLVDPAAPMALGAGMAGARQKCRPGGQT